MFDFGDEGGDHSADFVVVGVILPILEMVAMHDPGFSLIGFHFPVVEVYFLEEFFLMVLELPHLPTRSDC